MTTTMQNPFMFMVSVRHLLTPVALVRFTKKEANFYGEVSSTSFRILYVFGIRIAYWTVV